MSLDDPNQHVYHCDSDHVTIPIEEYERLIGDQRRVQSCRDIMDEYYVRRKLLLEKELYTDQQRMSLRRVTLNKLSVRLSRSWDG